VELSGPGGRLAPRPGPTARRVAEDAAAPLGFFPVTWGRLVLACNQNEILAIDAATGRPAWGTTAVVYRDQIDDAVAWAQDPPDTLGVPRHTLTVCEGRLFARLGSSVTARPLGSTVHLASGSLVALDLAAEGRLLWKYVPEEGWAVEGAPLARGGDVYVALRRNDVRPQAHVACLEARSGGLRWRRFVCAAETPARNTLHESTHNLLTLDGDRLYYNTNLGAVAALATRDGRIEWVSLYPRSRQGDLARLAPHWQRDLTPCLYHRGTLLVAPADSPRIFALDAATGQILWQTNTEVEDAVHLLGATDEYLVAGGERLYFIGLSEPVQGRVRRVWPEGNERLGYGRGILAGGSVWWPTRGKIFRLSLATGLPEKVFDLAPRGVEGGNLLVAGGRLLLATSSELIAMEPRPKRSEPSGNETTDDHKLTGTHVCSLTTTCKPSGN